MQPLSRWSPSSLVSWNHHRNIPFKYSLWSSFDIVFTNFEVSSWFFQRADNIGLLIKKCDFTIFGNFIFVPHFFIFVSTAHWNFNILRGDCVVKVFLIHYIQHKCAAQFQLPLKWIYVNSFHFSPSESLDI